MVWWDFEICSGCFGILVDFLLLIWPPWWSIEISSGPTPKGYIWPCQVMDAHAIGCLVLVQISQGPIPRINEGIITQFPPTSQKWSIFKEKKSTLTDPHPTSDPTRITPHQPPQKPSSLQYYILGLHFPFTKPAMWAEDTLERVIRDHLQHQMRVNNKQPWPNHLFSQ